MAREFIKTLCIACCWMMPASGCSDGLETVTLEINGIPFVVEVARTEEEQRQGLMLRKKMPLDHGMLFPYESDRVLHFWMKDTILPLSIAFISSDGIIMEIYDMSPKSLRTVSSRQSVRYALEVNQGVFGARTRGPGTTGGDQRLFPDRCFW